MRRALLVVGLTLAMTSTAFAACPCVQYHERVTIDRYAVRMGHFFVALCGWKPHNPLVCVAERFEPAPSVAFGGRVLTCRAELEAIAVRERVR
jgi:hypothetical protein